MSVCFCCRSFLDSESQLHRSGGPQARAEGTGFEGTHSSSSFLEKPLSASAGRSATSADRSARPRQERWPLGVRLRREGTQSSKLRARRRQSRAAARCRALSGTRSSRERSCVPPEPGRGWALGRRGPGRAGSIATGGLQRQKQNFQTGEKQSNTFKPSISGC